MSSENFWKELTTKVVQLYQQLQLSDQQVQITITAEQISFIRRKQPAKKEVVYQEAILQVIIQTWSEQMKESWINGNVFDEIRHHWQKIHSRPVRTKRKRTGILFDHFAIGASLNRHSKRLQEVELLWNADEESSKILQEVTQLRCVKFLYKICSQLFDLFQECSQAL